MNRSFAFIFVCQGGELEIKSVLLAASLKRFLQCNYELIAAIPGPAAKWPQPTAATHSFLSHLGIRTIAISNSIGDDYPIANKIECLRIRTDADKLVFLDSDMLLMRAFEDQPRFAIPFNARPASCATFTGSDELWREIYRACGAPFPAARIRTTFSGEYVLPYFNAAFVAAPGRSGLGDAWLDCCRTIDAMPQVPNRRPYLDQIALAVAASKLGMELDCLDERFNHPINFKPLNELSLPWFCHYHDLQTLAREPAAVALVQSLVAEDAQLKQVLSADPAWASMVDSPRRVAGDITPELIITGIPRSGTSYLCNLLHRLDNCVVLNEPVEAPHALMQDGLPWGVARLLRDVRRDVLAGKPIRNKLYEGKVSEDTAVAGELQEYIPKVQTPNFVLGIKATIAFLSRLPALRKVVPNARFVACVRHPLDTIASWKATFAHLRDANLASLNVGHPKDRWLSGVQRAELAAIAGIPDVPTRRAAWWRYLAGLVLENRDHLILVNYDALVTQPRTVLQRILDGRSGGGEREAIEPSVIRGRRENLDAADYAAVRAICTDAAEALGLSRDAAL